MLVVGVVHSAADVTMAKQSTTSVAKSGSKKHAAAKLSVVTKGAKSSTSTVKRAKQVSDAHTPVKSKRATTTQEHCVKLSSSETAQRYVLQVTGAGSIGSDGLVTNAVAPYGLGRSALERLGWRAGVSSVSTRAKGVLLAVLTPLMDDIVLKAMMVARADGLRTIQSGHVALAAEAHGVPLQC